MYSGERWGLQALELEVQRVWKATKTKPTDYGEGGRCGDECRKSKSSCPFVRSLHHLAEGMIILLERLSYINAAVSQSTTNMKLEWIGVEWQFSKFSHLLPS